MGVSCRNGGRFAEHSACGTDGSRNFRGAVTPQLIAFEDSVVRRHFGANISQWETDTGYHAYHLVNVIAVGRTIPMDRIWHEFARRPAPTIGTYNAPVKTGDRSIAMAAPTMGRGWGLPVPLPGGPVVHYIDKSLWALVNATVAPHVLHPGIIMRWFVRLPGSEVECHTVGRGITVLSRVNQAAGAGLARINETMGLEIFDELDMAIRAAI
ncbi:MAG: hypothetical protein JKY37_34390 [Nannocystaceae bacterium]|nr:hypothetical protein [Nannocystaceae bacterium]